MKIIGSKWNVTKLCMELLHFPIKLALWNQPADYIHLANMNIQGFRLQVLSDISLGNINFLVINIESDHLVLGAAPRWVYV